MVIKIWGYLIVRTFSKCTLKNNYCQKKMLKYIVKESFLSLKYTFLYFIKDLTY